MDDPTRWSDPAGGAPGEVQRLLAAARGGPPPIPDGVRLASATAAARLGGPASATGWWSALKIVGLLSAVVVAGLAVTHRDALSPGAHRAPALRRPSAIASPGLPPAGLVTAPPIGPARPEVSPPVEAVPAAIARPPVADAEGHNQGAEAALLERARGLLSTGQVDLSLAALHDHARRFPRSALAEERDDLPFRARARDALTARVGVEADRFLRRHPDGIYSSEVRSMRAAHE
jgi:hypothetical protein